MYSDSQSDSDSLNHGNRSEPFNHAPPAPPPDSLLNNNTSSSQQPPIMPSDERVREGDGCKSLTRRLRILWATLVAVAILGISAFANGNENPTERAVYKEVVFDVNAPPGLEERKYRKQVFILEESRLERDNNSSELPFPVIDADDDVPQQTVPETAVEALECRESVINFVINATDAKDECNGLKKAFDMTCNSDEKPAKASADPASENNKSKRRRLFESKTRQKKPTLTLQIYKATRSLRDFARRHLWSSSSKDELFFPEDEIVGTAWEEARYQVLNDYDAEVHQDTRRRLVAEKELRSRITTRFLEEANASSAVELNATAVEPNQTVVSKPTDKKKVYLSMPTNKLHASDQMLSDTVMLGKEKEIEEAIKVYSNQTNVTRSSEAKEDAAASAKAVHDTAAAVSAVLNDPESVEARVCCASILNVYHEHCDKSSESNEMVSDSNLFIIVFIIAVCGAVKSMIRHFKIRWLPEAAGCILVGVLFGGVMSFIPHYDLSFDHDWFLRIMVPPIGKSSSKHI